MAQATVIQNGKKRSCKYCSKTCISDVGMSHHMRLKHPEKIKLYSCYTCQKDFTTEDMQTKHFSTVLHQFNCKKYDGADSQIENITHWLEIQDKERYYAYLYEIDLIEKQSTSRNPVPIEDLRTTPIEIPLENSIELTDPRLPRREEDHSDETNAEIIQDATEPNEELNSETIRSSNTDVQKTQESEEIQENCESTTNSDTLNDLDILFEEQRQKDSCTNEHNSRAPGEDPTMLPRPAYENTGITVVSQEEMDLSSNQTEIYTSPNENCEIIQEKDTENRILTFESDLELTEISQNVTDLPKQPSPSQTDVSNILNKISFVGRRQDKKRRIENSMKNDESEAAKISKVNTDYPELTTIELETLAELLHYLPTTSDNI